MSSNNTNHICVIYDGMIFYINNAMHNNEQCKEIRMKRDTTCFRSNDTEHLMNCNGGKDCSQFEAFMDKALIYFRNQGFLD